MENMGKYLNFEIYSRCFRSTPFFNKIRRCLKWNRKMNFKTCSSIRRKKLENIRVFLWLMKYKSVIFYLGKNNSFCCYCYRVLFYWNRWYRTNFYCSKSLLLQMLDQFFDKILDYSINCWIKWLKVYKLGRIDVSLIQFRQFLIKSTEKNHFG